ncbi:hypothetical protein KA005_77320 [bacterium]|nr:hypothetical protein [bacterium]
MPLENEKNELPVGIYHDTQRNRWRVRLYKQREVVHLSYHPNYQLAYATWELALKERELYEPRKLTPIPPTFYGLIQGFRLNS